MFKHRLMRKCLPLLCFVLAVFPAVAQKNYATNKAIVHFIAADDQDIDAVNNQVTSRLQANGDLSFIMLIKDFKFDMEGMQNHFNTEYMESDKFPRAFFNGKITNLKSVDFTKEGKYPITVSGNMQVHGVNKAMQTNGFIEIKGGVPKATAQFVVTLKDFGIGGLLIKMVADKINVSITAPFE